MDSLKVTVCFRNSPFVRFVRGVLVSCLFLHFFFLSFFMPSRAYAMDKNRTKPVRSSLAMQTPGFSLESDIFDLTQPVGSSLAMQTPGFSLESDIFDLTQPVGSSLAMQTPGFSLESDIFSFDLTQPVGSSLSMQTPGFSLESDIFSFDLTQPVGSSLAMQTPGFSLESDNDISVSDLISDVLKGMSDPDLSFFELNKSGGLEPGPYKSPCKKARLKSTSSSYQPLLLSSCSKEILSYKHRPVPKPTGCYKVQPIPSFKHKTFKEKKEEELRQKEEEFRQSELYTILKPQIGKELSKIHKINTNPNNISRWYTLEVGLPNIRWEEAAEALLGREKPILWKQKIEDLQKYQNYSAFYKSAAEWLLKKQEE